MGPLSSFNWLHQMGWTLGLWGHTELSFTKLKQDNNGLELIESKVPNFNKITMDWNLLKVEYQIQTYWS
jgi:hypothetical protein